MVYEAAILAPEDLDPRHQEVDLVVELLGAAGCSQGLSLAGNGYHPFEEAELFEGDFLEERQGLLGPHRQVDLVAAPSAHGDLVGQAIAVEASEEEVAAEAVDQEEHKGSADLAVCYDRLEARFAGGWVEVACR